MGEKFWAVWRATGGSAPSKRHGTKQAALDEASRLASQTNEEYYVLEVIGKIKLLQIPTVFIPIDQ